MRPYFTDAECQHCGKTVPKGGALTSHERSCAAGNSAQRKRSRYRELFFAHNGIGPYQCHFCSKDVVFDLVAVHHIDEDHTNDEISNLAPTHNTCHGQHHFKKMWAERREEMLAIPRGNRSPWTEEQKKRASESQKRSGNRPTPEAIAKAAEINRGTNRSLETRAKLSEKARNRTPEHQEKLAASTRGKKRTPEAREKMRQAALARCARARGGDAT